MKRQWLIDRRSGFGYTQQQVADKSDMDRAYYTMIETGYRNPSVSVAKRIAQTLDFDWTYFFANGGNETKHKIKNGG